MVTSTLPSTSSERNTVIHHVRTIMAYTTPLHDACLLNHAHIVQYLLSTGRVNPLTKTKYGTTALSYASANYDLIKLFQPFEECRTAFPVHTFTKLILTGDSGAGKTTITELIVRLASSTAVECVADVQRLTAAFHTTSRVSSWATLSCMLCWTARILLESCCRARASDAKVSSNVSVW